MNDNLVYEIRDPIHGMISFSELERQVINSTAFQRLRRIRQLSWTDYVYPGAMHTRFQHTIGVMHTASRVFDAIVGDKRSKEILSSAYGLNDAIVDRQKVIIRIAALVHDLGHTPFSHAGEDLLPIKNNNNNEAEERYSHEDYSVKIFERMIFPLIENSNEISSMSITCNEICGLVSGFPQNPLGALCRDIISGRLDADRMDYLLRDSYYCGVMYGHYEFERLLNTICVCEDSEDDTPVIGIREDGIHAAEGLLLARYMMFHNVYFHKTRVIYDFHYQMALKELLGSKGVFPKLEKDSELRKFVNWDDWKVQGLLSSGKGGKHGKILSERNHYRLVYQTRESFENEATAEKAFEKFDAIAEMSDMDSSYIWEAHKSFSTDMPVEVEEGTKHLTRPMLELSGVLKSLRPLNQRRLYVAESVSDSFRLKIDALG